MDISKTLRSFIFLGLFLTPFIVFFKFDSMFFPFIAGKGFVFRILIELVFAAWIVLMLKNEMYQPKRSWILYAMTIFLVVITLADVFGVNPYRSFWSNYERMEGLVTLLHLFGYFIVLGTVLSTEKLWSRFFNMSLVANTLLCLFSALPQIYGSAQIYQSSDRVEATLGNATYFAAYLMIHIFIALFLLLRTSKTYARVLYVLSIVLQLLVLYHTQTRGAALGLIGGLFVSTVLIAIFEKQRKKTRTIAISVLAALVLVVGGFFFIKDSAFVKNSPTLKRFAEISLSESFLQGQGRYYIWPIAIQGFKERPILGWGQENFLYVFNKNYNPHMYSQEPWFDRTHNVVLDWLIAGGILGLASYLLLFVMLLVFIWRGRGGEFSIADKSVLTGLLAAYFFQNLFVFDNITSYMLFFSILAYVYAIRTRPEARSIVPRAFYQPMAFKIAGPVVVILLIPTLYFGIIKPIYANTALIDALTLAANPQTYPQTIEAFKRSISYETFGKMEGREQMVLFAQRINTDQIPKETRAEALQFAATEMQNQIKESKTPDARQYLFMGGLLARYGLLDQALSFLSQAHELSPKKQSIYFEIGDVYLTQGKSTEALETLKQAFDLDQNFTQARMRYAAAAIETQQLALANELLKGVQEGEYILDNRLLNAYVTAKQWDSVIEIFQKRRELDPKNPQFIVSLAAAYLEVGNRAAAIEALEDFIALDPAKYQQQGELYINEIRAGRNP